MQTSTTTIAFPRIDRFDVLKILGRGAQGTVFLANDTRLQRQVALKTLRGGSNADAAAGAQLAEARMVSGLHHPNIVTLFDAQQEQGATYLVFEYVEGSTLADLIRQRGKLPPQEAISLAIGILHGLACAHEHATLHCDLKPSNIMVASDGTPRVMDFGVAQRSSGSGGKNDRSLRDAKTAQVAAGFSGTPAYLAPEVANGASASVASDLFAAGIVLYEMLTGAPPIVGGNAYETIHRMAQDDFAPASSRNSSVDAKLNQIVMRAISKNPDDRFVAAHAMIAALEDYLLPAPVDKGGGESSSATLEFLLQRMRFKSDFPILSEAVSAINRVVSSTREPTSTLTNIILKDVALTNKILRIVNAAHYKQFGGSISTISRAVAILGFDTIRNTALSLVLFEHLQNRSQAADLYDVVGGCFFSSVLATELANKLGVGNAEEVSICAMFHRLGKLAVTFYLHEEAGQIARLAQAQNISDDRAAVTVIGVSYAELGVGVAKHWNLPAPIIASMKACDGEQISRSLYDNEYARVIASCATELAELSVSGDAAARKTSLARIMGKYGRAMNVSEQSLSRVLDSAAERFKVETATIGLRCRTGRIAAEAGTIAATMRGDNDKTIEDVRHSQQSTNAAGGLPNVQSEGGPTTLPGEIPAAEIPGIDDSRAQLMAGIQDITNTLAGDYDLNNALRIILETIYRGGRFDRVLLFARDARGQNLHCRLGFGRDAERLSREALTISMEASRDVFYGALSRGADVAIQDVDAEKVAAFIPPWYRKKLGARGMLLLPLMVKAKAIGMIYADRDQGVVSFEEADLRLLRTLRSQAVMAIKQKDSH